MTHPGGSFLVRQTYAYPFHSRIESVVPTASPLFVLTLHILYRSSVGLICEHASSDLGACSRIGSKNIKCLMKMKYKIMSDLHLVWPISPHSAGLVYRQLTRADAISERAWLSLGLP